MSTTLFTNARAVDATGETEGFWMLVDDDVIVATGSTAEQAFPLEAPGRHRDGRDGLGGALPVADVVVDLDGARLTPGLVDLHTHGGGGASHDGSADEIERGLALHRSHGTTRSLVSLVANPIDRLRGSLETIADLRRRDPLVLGAHLEGPFLAPHRKGAHAEQHLAVPSPENVDALLGAVPGVVRQVTLAPELPGGLDAVERIVAAGAVVAVGHTDADHDLAVAAFDRGATMMTHAFNAIAGIGHREPGPVVAAVSDDRVTIELILDGVHVHPEVVRMVFASAPGRVALITDAMSAAGSADGDYLLGELAVTVSDGVAVLAGTDTIAGSTLTQDAALRLALTGAQQSPVCAVEALTTVPAKAIGEEERIGLLAPGYVADAVAWTDDWHVSRVWAAGRELTDGR
jgi:N-acetylglucosamine-6-phosphate deacetylase